MERQPRKIEPIAREAWVVVQDEAHKVLQEAQGRGCARDMNGVLQFFSSRTMGVEDTKDWPRK